MAYTPNEWQCGDTVTADKLNNLEEGIQEALECCGGSAGYECVDDKNTIFNETATTVNDGSVNDAPLAYSSDITLEYVNVTFDGVDYLNVPRVFDDEWQLWIYGEVSYGMPVFTTYPFMLRMQADGDNILYTENPTTCDIEVWTGERTITTTECFREAVKEVTAPLIVNLINSGGDTVFDKTWQEVYNAFSSGRTVLCKPQGNTFMMSVVLVDANPNEYVVADGTGNYYTTDSADGYPTQS